MNAAERNLLGTPKKRKRSPARPASRGDAPVAPLCLSQRAFDVWNELVPLYQAKGLLVQLDSDMLGVYCQMRADREEALETVEREGRYYTTANGLRRLHPAVGVAARAAVAMMRLASELGLFPRARAVLEPERVPGEEKSTKGSWCRLADGPECKTPSDCTACPHYERELARHHNGCYLD